MARLFAQDIVTTAVNIAKIIPTAYLSTICYCRLARECWLSLSTRPGLTNLLLHD